MRDDPGYIKGCLPGVRENGGQYTHAAVWTVVALARLGMGDEAMELFHMLNPINHTRTPEDADRYKVEPFAVAADVYAHPMHVGRRLDVVHRLGGLDVPGGRRGAVGLASQWFDHPHRALYSRRVGSVLHRLDAGQDAISLHRHHPEHQSRGVASAHRDGIAVDPRAIPLHEDDGEHTVAVVLGDARAPGLGEEPERLRGLVSG